MASSSMSLRPAIGGAHLDRLPVTRLAQNAAVCREPSRARNGSLACRSAVTGIDSDPASFDAVHHRSLDQEWLRLGLSIAPDGGSRLDEEWLRLGLSFPSRAVSASAADLDAVWLQLGLTVSDSEPIVITPEGAMTVSEAVAASESRALAPEAPPTVVEVDPSSYFKEDLRPIVLFDGEILLQCVSRRLRVPHVLCNPALHFCPNDMCRCAIGALCDSTLEPLLVSLLSRLPCLCPPCVMIRRMQLLQQMDHLPPGQRSLGVSQMVNGHAAEPLLSSSPAPRHM